MVEVDVQLLVGAATTVFLALMFFGVVVLWDVALALRSVGDKIDKLEDNIDDDLTDIGHALDGLSNAPGGGGGTQLHLSGGTISSGPAPSQAQGGPTQGGQPEATGGPQAQPQTQPPHQRKRPADRPSQGPAASGVEGDREPTADAATEGPADGSGAMADDEADGSEPAVDESAPEETERPDEAEPDSEPEHPRADRNRGRFVTSPDRTAWYAIPLDREAIRAASEPSIAGELTDGSEPTVDESEIVAAGPVESAEPDAVEEPADRDRAGAAPDEADETAESGSTDTEEPTAGDATDPESDGTDSDTEPDEPAGETAAETVEDKPDADDGPESDPDEDIDENDPDDASTDDGTVLSFDQGATDDATGAETPSNRAEPNGDDAANRQAADEADAADGTADTDERSEPTETGLEPVEETADLPDADTDESSALERPAAEDGDLESPQEGDGEADAETGDGPGSDPEVGDVTTFEFDEELAVEDDVTVEEAVDTINEDAPAPELSSHEFDVSAEIHAGEEGADGGESAVLVFEFDADTVDISGSTKRLLQYQMRSFADRESSPDGDVTIGQQRIVIEIPDSDGNAVQQWGEAAVSIIDRTLYLSDNSSDDR